MNLIKTKKENKSLEDFNKNNQKDKLKTRVISKKEFIKFDEKEKRILLKIKENLKTKNIILNDHSIVKFILKNIKPDMLTRKIIKSKIKAEEILNKAKNKADRLWL